MNPNPKLPTPVSPRFAGAFFFAIYALLFLLFTRYTLFSLNTTSLSSLLWTSLAALITGAFAGWCFGAALAKKSKGLRSFFLGILLAFLCLILLSFAFLVHGYFNKSILIYKAHWKDYLVIYGTLLLSLISTIGLVFIPLTGLIAIYFNKQFLPGLIAADKARLEKELLENSDKSDDQL